MQQYPQQHPQTPGGQGGQPPPNHQQQQQQQQHHAQHQSGDQSTSSQHSYEESAVPFFADMTLDLAEAHDIAETPEPVTGKTLIENPTPNMMMLHGFPTMPTLAESAHNNKNNSKRSNNNNNNNDDSYIANPLSQTIPSSSSSPPSPPSSRLSTENEQVTFLQQRPSSPSQSIPPSAAAAAAMSSSSSSPSPSSTIEQHDNNQQKYIKKSITTPTTTPPNNNNNHDVDFSPNHIMGHVTSRSFGTGFRSRFQQRRRQWPKDVSWAISFFIIVPICLIMPIIFAPNTHSHSITTTTTTTTNNSNVWLATAIAPRLAVLHTLFWGLGTAIIVSRILYRTIGGGDGDDERHLASQILLSSAPISISVYIMIIVSINFFTPTAFWPYSLIPVWYLSRDLYLFRRWKMTATTPGGRQAFFQALSCMTLDILSRSLRRNSLWRMVVSIIIFQFIIIIWWRVALLAAIQSKSIIWIIMAGMGGKWATGTVARLLTLLACGGISNWFAEQSSLVEEMQQQEQQQKSMIVDNNNHDDDDHEEEEMIEFATINNDDSMPEAYRSADASTYRSVLQDEGMADDEFHDEDDEEGENNGYSHGRRQGQQGMNDNNNDQSRYTLSRPTHTRTTAKQLLIAGVTVNFGSVAKCGLLGGLAQVLWSQIRKIDHARAAFRGMQGMTIGGDSESNLDNDQNRVQGCFNKIMFQVNNLARDFVRNHSDMAMSYVAEYQLSYTRAAQEVALLIDESGVEPIIHDDISTHMSSCVGGSVSGLIVLFTGAVLVHQRNRNSPDVPDSAIVLDMLLAFFFCYTLIFTVMEPLRASIKGVYVCFAQHPESLSQAFPLIFHRLTRMSQSNLH